VSEGSARPPLPHDTTPRMTGRSPISGNRGVRHSQLARSALTAGARATVPFMVADSIDRKYLNTGQSGALTTAVSQICAVTDQATRVIWC
jgi:hypothetical protein